MSINPFKSIFNLMIGIAVVVILLSVYLAKYESCPENWQNNQFRGIKAEDITQITILRTIPGYRANLVPQDCIITDSIVFGQFLKHAKGFRTTRFNRLPGQEWEAMVSINFKHRAPILMYADFFPYDGYCFQFPTTCFAPRDYERNNALGKWLESATGYSVPVK